MILLTPYVFLGLKILILALLAVHAVFAGLVLSKVKFLSKIVKTEVSPVLLAVAAINLIVPLALLALALVIL